MHERYELLHDGTEVLGRHTKLIWRRSARGMTLRDDRCVNNDAVAAPLPARDAERREPTVQELLTLVLYPRNAASRVLQVVIDELAFPDTPLHQFEKNNMSDDIMRWVDFGSGRARMCRPLSAYHRVVRDAYPLKR